jgi:hypothetical protein
MVRLAAEFRAQRADETAQILDARNSEREAYIQAREQVSWLRAKRAELERRMMAQGIELPKDRDDD